MISRLQIKSGFRGVPRDLALQIAVIGYYFQIALEKEPKASVSLMGSLQIIDNPDRDA